MREIMDVPGVADYLGIGVAKVYQLLAHKEIPASRIGKQYRFLREVINAWLKTNIIMEDKQFLQLIQDLQQESKNAGYTQKDVEQAVAQVRKEAKRRS
jgi:excisionase family DNA binding protein